MKIILSVCAFAVTFASNGFSQSSDAATSYECKQGKVTRSVKIEYSSAPAKVPCKVMYVKDVDANAEAKSIFNAEKKEGFCEEKLAAFIEKTQAAGFTCSAR